jgi:hypothetical protein
LSAAAISSLAILLFNATAGAQIEPERVRNGFRGSMRSTPELILKASLGETGPEEEILFRPAGMIFDEQGYVYVPDGGHHSILVFDRQGAYHRRIGREGQGPGEIDIPSQVFFSWEGELVVHDQGNNRVSHFSREGEFLRSRNIESGPGLFFIIGGEQQIPTDTGDYLRPGPRIVPLPPDLGGTPEAERYMAPLLNIVNIEGEVIRSLGERISHRDPHTENMMNEVSFDFRRGEIAVAFNLHDEIRLYDCGSGDLKRVISRRLAFDPVEPSMQETEQPSPDGREVLLVLVAFIDPVSFDVAYDPAGRIWVITSLVSSDEEEARQESGDFYDIVRLEVFSPEGELLTTIGMEEPVNRIAFDSEGDLWLLDNRYNSTLRRYEVIWP